MLLNVFDKYKPRTVLSSVCLLVLNCWVALTQLGVVGVNLDLEKKQSVIRDASTWILEADQSCLSWSFGLAAFVLFFVLIALNILVWCVYPRKGNGNALAAMTTLTYFLSLCIMQKWKEKVMERGGRLLTRAWTWPTGKDLPCCLSQNSSYRQESRRAKSFSAQQQMKLTRFHHQTADSSRDTDLSSLDVGTYDPRSADVVSEGNVSGGIPISSAEISTAAAKLGEDVEHGRGATSHQHDPRTAVDVNFSRVSSHMSSVRSSNGDSSGFVRARNLTYVIKKGQNQPVQQTVIPKPLVPGKMH
ncbi:hypothetical protein TcWFU_010084 [Taenia crassiceps]|uniref:Uncharacterized protein n=1 Tax=Taenia crassiceps TaxID=6207 RepID=A0ABR4Q8G8_9CEST